MSWILDLALVLVFVICVWKGHRQGLIKALTGILAFLVALTVSLMLNAPVANLLYANVVEPPIVEAIEGVLGEGGSLTESADGALESMPGFLRNLLEKADITSGQDIVNKLTGEDGVESYAHRISDQAVRPTATKLLQAVSTLLLFLIGLVAAHLVLRVLNVLAKLPLLKQLNNTLGLAAGVVSGVLWVLFLGCILQVVAAVSGSDALINQTVVEQTYLLRFISGFNPLSGRLQDLLTLA